MNLLDFIKKYAHLPEHFLSNLTLDCAKSNIKHLDLSKTDIRKLPESIGELTNLKNLFLGHIRTEELLDSYDGLSEIK